MKAIVMETRGREAAILLRDGTFRTVKGRYSVGETIDCQETVRPAFRKWMAAAAAAVIMIGTGGGFWYDANYVAYAEISLDINPSIVYTVNKRSRVLSVRAVNDEASETVSALEKEGIRFMPVAEAIDRTMTLFENEGYLDADTDGFYESYYSHTQNEDFNVVGVGDALAEALEKQGIAVLHDKTVHDSTYNGSYDRSAETVNADLEENGDIKIVLDIHRDALGSEDNKVKTVCGQNGEKTAQMMILSGCDYYGERGFDNWQNNLNFALKLQNAAGEMYPNLMRPLSFDFFAYNEYICDGSLLIEIGTDANSIDEAQRAAVCLADVIAKVVTE